ncbi:hypothetical protein QBC43DRAFT_318065 [Cladorrhinum sp. PSN259]|nr:hypothetical protein QBC43DRAFT_318065 [Cladorrhinum sp. PSN259]
MSNQYSPTIEFDDDFFLGLNRPNSTSSSSSTLAASTQASSSSRSFAASARRTLRRKRSLSNLPKILENQSSSPDSRTPVPPQDKDDLIFLPRARELAKEAAEDFEEVREGLRIAQDALSSAGVLQVLANQTVVNEMEEFDKAISQRRERAAELVKYLEGTNEDDWLGKGNKFDKSVRRIKVIKGFEGSLKCWEPIVVNLLWLAEQGEKGKNVDVEVMRSVVGRWRVGMPSRP